MANQPTLWGVSWSVLRSSEGHSYGLYLYLPLTVLLEPMKPWLMGWIGSFAIVSVVWYDATLR